MFTRNCVQQLSKMTKNLFAQNLTVSEINFSMHAISRSDAGRLLILGPRATEVSCCKICRYQPEFKSSFGFDNRSKVWEEPFALAPATGNQSTYLMLGCDEVSSDEARFCVKEAPITWKSWPPRGLKPWPFKNYFLSIWKPRKGTAAAASNQVDERRQNMKYDDLGLGSCVLFKERVNKITKLIMNL